MSTNVEKETMARYELAIGAEGFAPVYIPATFMIYGVPSIMSVTLDLGIVLRGIPRNLTCFLVNNGTGPAHALSHGGGSEFVALIDPFPFYGAPKEALYWGEDATVGSQESGWVGIEVTLPLNERDPIESIHEIYYVDSRGQAYTSTLTILGEPMKPPEMSVEGNLDLVGALGGVAETYITVCNTVSKSVETDCYIRLPSWLDFAGDYNKTVEPGGCFDVPLVTKMVSRDEEGTIGLLCYALWDHATNSYWWTDDSVSLSATLRALILLESPLEEVVAFPDVVSKVLLTVPIGGEIHSIDLPEGWSCEPPELPWLIGDPVPVEESYSSYMSYSSDMSYSSYRLLGEVPDSEINQTDQRIHERRLQGKMWNMAEALDVQYILNHIDQFTMTLYSSDTCSIYDGGSDVFDTGNRLSVILANGDYEELCYTEFPMMVSLGGGSYMASTTRQYEWQSSDQSDLFVAVLDMKIRGFQVSGNLGANYAGYQRSGCFPLHEGPYGPDCAYTSGWCVFYYQVYDAPDPSVNQMIITDNCQWEHDAYGTDDYMQRVSGSPSSSMLYYLMFAGKEWAFYGYEVWLSELHDVATKFMELVGTPPVKIHIAAVYLTASEDAADGDVVFHYGGVGEGPARELVLPARTTTLNVVMPEQMESEAEYTGARIATMEMENHGDVPLHLRARMAPPETLEEAQNWYVVTDAETAESVCYMREYEEVFFDDLTGDHGFNYTMTASFPFLGKEVSTIFVAVDGFVSFAMPKVAVVDPIMGGISSSGLIAPFLADLFMDDESSISANLCDMATEIWWDNMILLATGRRVSFGLIIFSNGAFHLVPPKDDGEFGVVGMEGAQGEMLWSRPANSPAFALSVAPWLRMPSWTGEMGPGKHEFPMIMMADNVLGGGHYSSAANIKFDVVTPSMQCIAIMPFKAEVMNPNVPKPPPGTPPGSSYLETCAPDEAVVAAEDQAISCKLVAALCPGYCVVETPSPTPLPTKCKDEWSKSKCKKQATDKKCKTNDKVQVNCAKTCGLCD
jgi:hypothetical protein